jgi:hypothetical protein
MEIETARRIVLIVELNFGNITPNEIKVTRRRFSVIDFLMENSTIIVELRCIASLQSRL